MFKTLRIYAAAVLVSLFNLPLNAQTALEQIQAAAPAAEFAIPAPVMAAAGPAGLARQEALAKLPLFDYQKSDVLSVTRTAPADRREYTKEVIGFRINDPLRQRGEYDQQFIFYRTKKAGPRPTVLIYSPFSGSKTIDVWTAKDFARKGYNAVVIIPTESLTDKTRPLDKTDDLLIREVITARMLIDLLETLPEVDPSRIYANGISMGGIRTALAFGVEPRIRKATEVVGGGDLPGVIADTHFALLKGVRDARMKIEGIATLADFRAYMEKVMTVDPMDFGCLREPEDFMVVMGRGDQFVRDVYQQKLYDAFSRPGDGRFPVLVRSKVGHILTAVEIGKHVDQFMEFFER